MARDDYTPNQPTVRIPNREDFSLTSARTGPHITSSQNNNNTQKNVADIARTQIDKIYNNDQNHLMAVEAEPATGAPQPQPTTSTLDNTPLVQADNVTASPQTLPQISKYAYETDQSKSIEADNPYQRSYESTDLTASKQSWQEYHSAWQNYYQQYFQRYYAGHLQQAQANNPSSQATVQSALTPEQAMDDIRSKLRARVSQQAKQVRNSRHFIPILAACLVMLLFIFLQYNRLIIANVQAYVSPGAFEPSNIIVDPSTELTVGPEPRLILPKINVDVPVVWNAKPDHDSQMKAMEKGVAWFGIPGANSKPGQIGNTVLSGHSSNDWMDNGQYKFIFARLEQMKKDDTIYINYEGTRYTYVVTRTETVKPTDVQALIYETDKPMLTLITCTPLGTALNRFLVTAEQVSPSPSQAADKPTPSSDGAEVEMPGNSPTFLQRVFGSDN